MKSIFVAGNKEHHVRGHFCCLKRKDTKKGKPDSGRKKYALSNGTKIKRIGGYPF
jgi:hypothetical protein